jgi:hypothetical protein
MTYRTSWAGYNQPRLLTGNLFAGIGEEVDSHQNSLRAQAAHEFAAYELLPGLRARVGHSLEHAGTAIEGMEAHERHLEPKVRTRGSNANRAPGH